MRRAAWAMAVLGLGAMAACFDPRPIEPTCGPQGECPEDQTCADGPGSECKLPGEVCDQVREQAYQSCMSQQTRPGASAEALQHAQRHCWAEDAADLFGHCCDYRRDGTCGPPPPEACSTPTLVTTAVVDTERTAMFNAFGNRGGGWTGGDGAISARLPDGRLLWTFSDTFLGTVQEDGSRPMTTPIVNSSFVIEGGGALSTVTQSSLVPAEASPRRWFWAGDNVVDGGVLRAVFHRFVGIGEGLWAFRLDGNVLAEFAIADLTRAPVITPLPSGQGILWGASILPADESGDGYTYVYGADDDTTSGAITRSMVVARVPGTDLKAPWQFLTSRGGWSSSERDAARVLHGVSNAYSVVPLRGQFMVITQDSTDPFSYRVVAIPACSPSGPFGRVAEVYLTPESGESGSYLNPKVFTYNARAHAELTEGTTFTLSYNVNSFEPADIFRDVTIYRPRFVTVTVH